MAVAAASMLFTLAVALIPSSVSAADYAAPAAEESQTLEIRLEETPYGILETMTQAEKAALFRQQQEALDMQQRRQRSAQMTSYMYEVDTGRTATKGELLREATGEVQTIENWQTPLVKDTWVVSPYGMRLHPVYGYYKMHNGVDLDSTYWDEIVAARSGTVCSVGYHWASGYYVEIDHGNGYITQYMHLSDYIVEEGQYVAGGDLIGYVGSSGTATGPHLHFGMIHNGSFVDPADYIDF